jgi:ATP-dependent Clp protease ATP-binding subunit ClpC
MNNCSICGENKSDLIHVLNGNQEMIVCSNCFIGQYGEDMNFAQPEGLSKFLSHVSSIFDQMAPATAGPVSHPDPDKDATRILGLASNMASYSDSPVCSPEVLLKAMITSKDSLEVLTKDYKISAAALKQINKELEEFLPLATTEPTLSRPSPELLDIVQIARRLAASEGNQEFSLKNLIEGVVLEETSPAGQLLHGAGLKLKKSLPKQKPQSNTPTLDQFGRDLTLDASKGEIDPVIGRSLEIEQTVEILARRRKNNPVLIGEPGVGKTAIVEGLALRIVNGDVPETIKDSRLISIDMASLVAGTQFRGQFEDRLKTIIKEIKSSNVIVFVDEIHTIIGAGDSEGGTDAANIIKPALARGDLHLVGATTLKEYRRIEKDGALSRRFSAVTIKEPSRKETLEILEGLKPFYEAHHKVVISKEALVAACDLSERYISEYFLPDKAIDLIDQASARAHLRALKEVETNNLKDLKQDLDKAVHDQDFELAATIKKEIEAVDSDLASNQVVGVTKEDIAEVLSLKTKIPLSEIMISESKRLIDLELDLTNRVVGQDEAVGLVSDVVRRSRVGVSNHDGPIGTFLFLGPTGVGKTELAKALTERLFQTEKALVRIDMSEYRESHTTARLIGSPPGYVGYGEGGQLTEAVRRNPYSVILLDEIEKANPAIHNLLLQLLDDGRLTDGEGRVIDFTNTIIIMTSNLGATKLKKLPVGFSSTEEEIQGNVISEVKKAFAPELFNRIDEVVIFNPLTEDQIILIAEKIINQLSLNLKETRGISLKVTKKLTKQLAKDGFDPEYGARPLLRHIRRTLEKDLTNLILKDPDIKTIRANLVASKIKLTPS